MSEDKEQQQETGQEKKKRPNLLGIIIGGDLLQSRMVLRQVPLIVLCCIYALLLVRNRYQVEDLTKAKLVAQDSINCLRERRIELQKRYQETIKISQIEKMLDSTGVGIKAGPPYEI